jgi:hypothetical protein
VLRNILRRRASLERWIRLSAAVLSLLVALGAQLPYFARLVAGPKAHVCHCETGKGHAHCACPICFPDREPDLGTFDVTLKGRCGDDDPGWPVYSDPALVPAMVVAVVSHDVVLVPEWNEELAARPPPPPDPRPPRLVS